MNDLILSIWVFGITFFLTMAFWLHLYFYENYKPAKKAKESGKTKESEIDRRINELIKEIDNDRIRL